jgi:phospholipid/cholesterol/gamma-HCH transport system substrate-binding protein
MTPFLPRFQSLVVAILVGSALILAGIGLFAVGDHRQLWSDSILQEARFSEISGVQLGTRVRVKGINAGQVVAIRQPAQRDGDVILVLRVDRQLHGLLGSDAKAVILSEGLVGGKVIELLPGSTGQLQPGDVIAGEPDAMMKQLRDLAAQSQKLLEDLQEVARQATGTLAQSQALVEDIRKGQGPVGQELVTTLHQLQDASEALANSFHALRNLPWVGEYTLPAEHQLLRPHMRSQTFVLQEKELFEPGRAILTRAGQERLDQLVANDLESYRSVRGSEIVIAAYTDSTVPPQEAAVLTQRQAETVRSYLIERHKLNRFGWLGSRKITALGMGSRPSRGSASEGANHPRRRVEIIVFAPPEPLSGQEEGPAEDGTPTFPEESQTQRPARK